MSATCPNPELLSRLVDGDFEGVGPEVEADVRGHVETCGRCQGELSGLERAAGLLRGKTRKDAPSAGRASMDECLTQAELLSVLEPVPSSRVESHLEGCDSCLREATALLRTREAAERVAVPVPAALAERVASRWKTTEPESVTEVVLRLGRAGLEILRREVIAPLVEVEPTAMPLAVRSGSESSREPVRFHLRAAAGSIEATAFPDGDAVRLELALHDAGGANLAGQRVYLRQNGRSLFSARSGDDGRVQLPRIEPGTYEVSCSAIDTTFRLDLRN